MLQWVLMRSGFWNKRQSSGWAGQDGSWVPLGGVFYHVGSCFDTREDSGSGAVGRAQRAGSVRRLQLFSQSERVSLPISRVTLPIAVMSSQTSKWEAGARWTVAEAPKAAQNMVVPTQPALGVVQRRNSLTATMSPCVSPSPTGPPIPLPRSWPWSRPSSWARVGQAKTFRGELGSTNQKLAVGLGAADSTTLSARQPARPLPPADFAALWPDVPSWAKKTWRGMAWPWQALRAALVCPRFSFLSRLVGSLGLVEFAGLL